MGVLGLFLKRINRLEQADGPVLTLHAVGTYNHLVARITATSFSCQELQVLQHTLTEGHPAEKALRTLNRILSSFDQRNNVLIARYPERHLPERPAPHPAARPLAGKLSRERVHLARYDTAFRRTSEYGNLSLQPSGLLHPGS
ncbi:MAG: hypothetical protein ACLR8Y_21520 [Alistipes indistinctus]